MSQCKKILENGERCSNPAVPGTDVCEKHESRISFRPVSKQPEKAAQSPQPPPAPAPTGAQAQPSAAGQKPSFPGLHANERNILVAPQGLVWLKAQADGSTTQQFDRLVRLLGSLSDTLTLSDHIRLQRQGEAGDVLLFLSPDNPEDSGLASLYDTVAWVARQVDAEFYIGQDRRFIQYRDDEAPRGYDAPKSRSPKKSAKKLLLVDNQGTHTIALTAFAEWPLSELLLQAAPFPEAGITDSEPFYALAPTALHPLLAPYFHAHHLHYRLAHLQQDKNGMILFEISPRPDAPSGRTVPTFVLDYLTRLPRVAVLTLAHQSDEQRVLLQWKHRYPLYIPHAATAFDPKDWVLLMADPYPNLRVNPAPHFIDGDSLARFHPPQPTPQHVKPQSTNAKSVLELPLLLRADPGPLPPVAALVLNAQELAWLRPLLYRLPKDAFRNYSLCMGQDRAVLVGGNSPIEGIPFGLPLRRLGDSELFIPLRKRFVPELPWDIIRQALALQDGWYTFFTEDYRLDLPTADFSPLSRVLVANPGCPTISFQMRPTPSLPELRWTAPSPPVEKTVEPAKSGGILGSLKRGLKRPPAPVEQTNAEKQQTDQDLRMQLLKQAHAYEQENDYLAAAICYSLLQDPVSSARCYRQAAVTGIAR